jgi:hypothetical protein
LLYVIDQEILDQHVLQQLKLRLWVSLLFRLLQDGGYVLLGGRRALHHQRRRSALELRQLGDDCLLLEQVRALLHPLGVLESLQLLLKLLMYLQQLRRLRTRLPLVLRRHLRLLEFGAVPPVVIHGSGALALGSLFRHLEVSLFLACLPLLRVCLSEGLTRLGGSWLRLQELLLEGKLLYPEVDLELAELALLTRPLQE